MIHLTERLDQYARQAMPSYPDDICSRAKQEIESLRAQLASARKALDAIDKHLDNFGYLPSMKARKLARNALKDTCHG